MSLPPGGGVTHWQEVPSGHATAHWHHLQGDEAWAEIADLDV